MRAPDGNRTAAQTAADQPRPPRAGLAGRARRWLGGVLAPPVRDSWFALAEHDPQTRLGPAPAAADAERTFIFAHIPKCGGKTLNSILERNFDPAYYREESLHAGYKYPPAEVRVILQRRFTLRCLSSHRLTFDLPWGNSARPIVGLTFVRDPAERAISNYFFQRSHARLENAAKHQSLEEFLFGAAPAEQNFQTAFLGRGRPNLALLAQLVEHGWAHIFPLERFAEVMLALERAYPQNFRDGSYKIHNQAPRDAEPEASLRARLNAASPLDVALLALAHRHLDTLLGRLFPGGAGLAPALEDLRRRNALRAGGAAENRLLPIS